MQTVFPPSDLYNWVSRIYEPGSRLLLTEYAFPVAFNIPDPNSVTTVNVQMTQNADFVMTSLDASNLIASTDDKADMRILITDTTTGEQFSQGAIPLIAMSYWPSTIFRRNLPYPRWFSGVSTISVSLLSTAGLGDEMQVSLKGFQIRRLG